MEINNVYLRFLNFVNALEASPYSPQMDLDAKKLLDMIIVRFAEQKTMTVTEAMSLNNIASPATIHRKLNLLLELGMIDMVFEGKNRRTKFLVPTKAACTYFDLMGKAVNAAANVNT